MSLFERVRKIDNYFKKANKKKTTTNKTKKFKKNPKTPKTYCCRLLGNLTQLIQTKKQSGCYGKTYPYIQARVYNRSCNIKTKMKKSETLFCFLIKINHLNFPNIL